MIPMNPHVHDASDGILITPFRFPDNIVAPSELIDYEMGGIAIQDTSKGLEYQVWEGKYDPLDSTVYLIPDDTKVPIPIFTEPDVIELAITFDQNMRWSAATRNTNNVMRHRWYDTAAESYVISEYTGVTSVRLALDDKRDIQIQLGAPDIILTYLQAGRIRWAIQRERFITQYGYSDRVFSANSRITHFGLGEVPRLQWRVAKRRIT